ncbi:MAG TPA: hypothetical protein PLR83_01920 [Pyrinomonadaceae bacterium]|nr:hypothetical protein [Pyrinomonadaceae bacterium]
MSSHFISRDDAESDLLAAATFIGERIRTADGQAESMSAVIPLYLLRGDVDLSAELANTVDDPFTRDKLIASVAQKCVEIDDNEYALQLVEAIEDDGMRLLALERFGMSKAASGDLELAREIASQMTQPDFVDAAIASAEAENGTVDSAKAAVDSVDFSTARVQAFQQIAAKWIEQKRADEAVLLLEASLEAADEIEHREEQVRAVCETGNLFITAERRDLAVKTFQKARDFASNIESTHKDFYLGSSALGLLQSGSNDLAEKALGEITDKTQFAGTLLAFARHLSNTGQADDALNDIEEAFEVLEGQQEKETRDSRARNSIWTAIAVQFAGFGYADRGIEIAKKNIDDRETAKAIGEIAQILATTGDLEKARETALLQEEAYDQAETLVSVVDTLTLKGETTKVAETLAEAEEITDTVPQISAKADLLIEIAKRRKDLGEAGIATATAEKAIASIVEIRDESRRVTSLANLSSAVTDISTLSESARNDLIHLIAAAEM